MADLADLFPGFESHWIGTNAGRIFARAGGEGEPVLLLHGFPETLVQWHRIAPELARTHRVVLMDLRGYGWSSAPRSEGGEAYSKRLMGEDVIDVMETLGHAQFALVGHDRGARVGYRLALDHPGRLSKLALLDIVPTIAMWERIAAHVTFENEHWLSLSRPAPEPENEILKDPIAWQNARLAGWSKTGDLSSFDARAVAHYRAFFNDPARIHACCEDYRAGATADRAADEADRAAGRRIVCPVLLLWGTAGIPAAGANPFEAWRDFAPHATGQAIDAGHFLAEENPSAVLAALRSWL
jgi:haloacetate dehalogenase